MLKKLILSLCIIFIFSCSSDDDSSANSINSINPPSWLQGKWLAENPDGSPLGNGFEFTSNDVIVITIVSEQSQKDYVEYLESLNQEVSVSETSSDNSYTLSIDISFGQNIVYAFNRISDTEITWLAVNNSVFTKQ